MNVLVAYLSKTGNTRKIAETIFGEIEEIKEIKQIDEVVTLTGYDIAFLGFPIHQGGPDKRAIKFLEKHCVGHRKVVLFITHASPEDSRDLPTSLEKFKQAARGANLIDMFDCQGELDKTTKLIMSILPSAQLRLWARLDNSKGQPDAVRLERARAFAKSVMGRVRADRELQEKVPAAVS